jgi:hypothetical protein
MKGCNALSIMAHLVAFVNELYEDFDYLKDKYTHA